MSGLRFKSGNRNPVVITTKVLAGTAIDFTDLPPWISGCILTTLQASTNGTSGIQVQLGPSSGIETTGYLGGVRDLIAGSSVTSTSGFLLSSTGVFAIGDLVSATLGITNYSINQWRASLNCRCDSTGELSIGQSWKVLADTLSQIRIKTVNGIDTFDGGGVNLVYW